jgi:hypothetical protein
MLEEINTQRSGITDPMSIVAEYLTGKKGSLAGQRNRLRQKLGVSLAPRQRGGSKKKRKARRTKMTRKH